MFVFVVLDSIAGFSNRLDRKQVKNISHFRHLPMRVLLFVVTVNAASIDERQFVCVWLFVHNFISSFAFFLSFLFKINCLWCEMSAFLLGVGRSLHSIRRFDCCCVFLVFVCFFLVENLLRCLIFVVSFVWLLLFVVFPVFCSRKP